MFLGITIWIIIASTVFGGFSARPGKDVREGAGNGLGTGWALILVIGADRGIFGIGLPGIRIMWVILDLDLDWACGLGVIVGGSGLFRVVGFLYY